MCVCVCVHARAPVYTLTDKILRCIDTFIIIIIISVCACVRACVRACVHACVRVCVFVRARACVRA